MIGSPVLSVTVPLMPLAAELVDDGEQNLVVDLVHTILVDVERRER